VSEQHVQPLTGERHPKEPDTAVLACNDYLRLGVNRSLRLLYEFMQKANDSLVKLPTVATVFGWSAKYNWQERAAAYDAQQDAVRTAEIARIKSEGLAAEHERIRRLARLADDLESQIFYRGVLNEDGDELAISESKPKDELQVGKRPHLWVRDVKQIGGGEFARQVTVYRYNSQIVSDYRGILDDIAKEVGGRKLQHELSGPDGGAIPLQHNILLALQEGYRDDE
jgi:hypothetical protein